MNDIRFDYFYGVPGDDGEYMRFQRVLVEDEYFRILSGDSKILYTIILDRMAAAEREGWIDELGRLYAIFTIKDVMDILGCSKSKAMRLLAQLDTREGVGLIYRKKQGFGMPDRIYVMNILEPTKASEEEPVEASEVKPVEASEIKPVEVFRLKPEEVSNSNSEGTCNTSAVPKYIDKQSFKPFDNIISNLSSPSSNPQITVTRVEESVTVTSKSLPVTREALITAEEDMVDCSNSRSKTLSVRDYNDYAGLIRENIEYDVLKQQSDGTEDELIDKLYRIMREVVTTDEPIIRIAGREMPAEVVRSRFLKLKADHIRHTISGIRSSPSTIHNFKAYALTVLYRSLEEQGAGILKSRESQTPHGSGNNGTYRQRSLGSTRGWNIQRQPRSWERNYTDEELRDLQVTLMEPRSIPREVPLSRGG